MYYQWTTDIYNPIYSELNYKFIKLFDIPIFSNSVTLSNGMKSYTFINDRSIPEAIEIISQITINPLTLSIETTDNINPHFIEIVKRLANNILKVNVTDVNITKYEDYTLLSFYDDVDTIYCYGKRLNIFHSLNFTKIINSRLISDDPLVYLAMNEINTGYYPEGWRIREIYGMVTLTIDENYVELDDEYVTRVRDRIYTLKSEGIFTYPKSLDEDSRYIEYMVRLSKIMGIKVISTNDTLMDSKVLSLLSPLQGLDYDWLTNSIYRLLSGRLPNYTISDIYTPTVIPRESYDVNLARAKVYALARNTLEIILPEIRDKEIFVGCDLSVTFPVKDIDTLISFINLLKERVKDIERWYTKLLVGKEVLTIPYFVSLNYPDINFYIFENENNKSTYIVIINYNSDISIPDTEYLYESALRVGIPSVSEKIIIKSRIQNIVSPRISFDSPNQVQVT